MVYVVSACVDEEYGCREAESVYSSREAAEAWVAEHQCYVDCWFCEDEQGYPVYAIEEFELH